MDIKEEIFSLTPIPHLARRMTAAIADFFLAGDSIEDLADDYGCTSAQIQEAIRLRLHLKLAPKSKAHLKKLLAQYVPGATPSMRLKALWHVIRYADEKGMESDLPEWVIPAYKQLILEGLRSCNTSG